MRIAFDLDDTLIPGRIPFGTEPVPRSWLRRWCCKESLRLGTTVLFNDLWKRGHEVWIYTTSLRRPLATKVMFLGYGTRVGKVINAYTHRRHMTLLGESYKSCAKYPPAFGIDLLIDDSEGILLESRHYNYEVIQVRPDDPDWSSVIRRHIGIDDR